MSTVTCEVEPSTYAYAAAGDERDRLHGMLRKGRLIFAGIGAGKGRRLGDGRPAASGAFAGYWYNALLLRRRGRMQVFVRTPAGRTLALDVHPCDTVDGVKAEIQARERVAAGQQRLLFAGRHLDDGRRTLADYGVGNEANLHLLLRLRGGAGAGACGDADTGHAATAIVRGARSHRASASAFGFLVTLVSVGASLHYNFTAAPGSGGSVAALLFTLWAAAVAGVNQIHAAVCLPGSDRAGVVSCTTDSKVGTFAPRNIAVLGVAVAALAGTGIVVSDSEPVLCFGFYALFLVAMFMVTIGLTGSTS